MSDNQGRFLHRFDHFGHGKRLAGASRAEQHLGPVAPLDSFRQFGNRFRLVT